MRDFIRELYESEISETSRSDMLSKVGTHALNKQENICLKLENTLKDDSLKLFQNYLNETAIVRNEEIFHAYVSGMKDLLRLFISVFDER